MTGLNFDEEDQQPESFETAKSITRPVVKQAKEPKTPASREAESHVIACCLIDDGLTLDRAMASLAPSSFYWPVHALVFSALTHLRANKQSIGVETLGVELSKQPEIFNQVGGWPALFEFTTSTTAHAHTMIEQVRDLARKRSLIRSAESLAERARSGADVAELEDIAATEFKPQPTTTGRLEARSLTSFIMPYKGDPSILIGDRYISRGDIAILASTSGMGKSSLSVQAAVSWGIGERLFGGFDPHRPLKSLIFQAEDGEGDVAEVMLSLRHAMKWTPEQEALVAKNVLIVTDRVHRGLSFRVELKRQIELHKPDLVWINPLLAFIGGDVNDSTDVGTFLREHLNSLNEPAQFAYIIVHHTAKPPKEKKDRQWNEIMYEMAGSADLTNAARAVLALQATDKEGRFKLIGAKRGTRAGLTELVPGVINPEIKFEHPTSTVAIKHSSDKMKVGDREMRVIHWEKDDALPAKEAKAPSGRPSKYRFEDFARWIPVGVENAKPAPQIWKMTNGATGISDNGLKFLLFRASKEGLCQLSDIPGRGPCFHL